MAYQKLSTTKYWNEVVEKEQQELRRQQNRAAMQKIWLCLFTVAVGVGVVIAVQTMPNWLPTVVAWVEQVSGKELMS